MRKWIPLFVLLGFAPGSAFAQGPGKGKGGTSLPLEGKELPDVTARDDSGSPISLREKLKGRYAVIVFGCLT